jgi:hypothetical protein
MMLAFAIDVGLSLLSLGALTGVPPHIATLPQSLQFPIAHVATDDLRRLVPRFFALIGCSPFANLTEMEMSTRLVSNVDQQDKLLPQVAGTRLKGHNLR